MNLLENHLEQISLSSTAIAELPFVPPKVFTNALLHSHDITALIRDTEAHERALFTAGTLRQSRNVRRSTVYAAGNNSHLKLNNTGLTRETGDGSVVARVLGPVLGPPTTKDTSNDGRESGEIDVDLLLKGAEKLCAVYPMPGVLEKIGSLRMRYEKLNSSIANYESRVAQQTTKLARMNRSKDATNGKDDLNVPKAQIEPMAGDQCRVTQEDLEKEAEEIRELEKKKLTLEDRVRGMERDLGGLSR